MNALAAALVLATAFAPEKPVPAPAHVVNSFHFTVAAPMARVAPLFAPVAERAWAGPDWQPVFLWPQPENDVPGAVFTVSHGDHSSIWITTLFDPAAGRMQYVYVLPGVLTTVIDVRVTGSDAAHTSVDVTYTRTALDSAKNEEVLHRGHADSLCAAEWKGQIESYLDAHQ